MHLVTRSLSPASLRPIAQQRVLRAERRLFLKRRWRGLAEDGTEFGFDLAERLAHGHVIFAQDDVDYVIHQIPEPVLEIPLGDPARAALLAWKLGNLHQSVQVLDTCLRVSDDPSVRRLLTQEALPFTEVTVAFQPLRVAAHVAENASFPPPTPAAPVSESLADSATSPASFPTPPISELRTPIPDSSCSIPTWLTSLMQTNDSQYPSGSYAHSFGLEELIASRRIRDPAGLRKFLSEQILPGLRALEFPMLARAHAAARAGDFEALRALDAEWEAWKAAAELRKASRQIGERRLALLSKLDPTPFVLRCRDAGAPHHQLLVLALETRAAPLEVAQTTLVYQTLTGYALAAMKLLRLGPEQCQLLLRELLAAFTTLPPAPPSPPAWFNPLLDIASLRHARSRERMFIS